MADDESSGLTAIFNAKEPVPAVQEALVAHDCDSFSANSILNIVRDIDTDYHTVAADSNYQAMLDEEQLSMAGCSTRVEKPENSDSFVRSTDVIQKLDNPHPRADIIEQRVQHLTVQSTEAKADTLLLRES
ncbi:hypothetical protein BJX99DRAFT_264441 [Aspergillus californicus]